MSKLTSLYRTDFANSATELSYVPLLEAIKNLRSKKGIPQPLTLRVPEHIEIPYDREVYSIDDTSDSYCVHYEHHWETPNTISFEAYSIIIYTNNTWQYTSQESDSIGVESFNKTNVRCVFEGTYTWRGVWEGRLYFKDDEYWGDELELMTKLYKKIEGYCQRNINTNGEMVNV